METTSGLAMAGTRGRMSDISRHDSSPRRRSRFLTTDIGSLSPAGRVALHAARIGGSAASPVLAGGGGETAFGPVRRDLDDMAATLELADARFRHTPLDDEHARPRRARPERDREMLGMPGRRVDRLLQIHAGMDVAQEELGRPLVLLIAARRAPGEIGFAVAQRQRRRERGARALTGRKRGWVARLEPEHLRPRAEAESEFRNDRGGLQPAAGRGRGDHVACAIHDIEMHGVAAHRAEPPDGRLAGPERADRRALARVAPQLDHGAEAFDRAGPELE